MLQRACRAIALIHEDDPFIRDIEYALKLLCHDFFNRLRCTAAYVNPVALEQPGKLAPIRFPA